MFAVSKVTVEAVVEASFLTVYWLIGQGAKERTFSGEKAIERKVAVIESPFTNFYSSFRRREARPQHFVSRASSA